MLGLFPAPPAILFELDFFSDEFLVLAGPVIDALTVYTGKLYKSIL